MKIEDGKGKGYTVGVDDENRLLTNSVSVSKEHNINHSHGDAYNLLFQVAKVSGGNAQVYMKNTADDDITVEGVWLRNTTPNQYVDITLGDTGTAAGGTTATPANLKANSGKSATGTFMYGNRITGLTQGTIVERFYLPSGNESNCYNFEQDLILGKNNTFAIYCSESGNRLDGHVIFNYHTEE